MAARTLVPFEKYLTDYADSTLTSAFDYDGVNQLIFMGRALAGTAKSSKEWQIKKFTYDGSGNLLDIQWAGGEGNFNKVWDDRASLEYA